MKRASPTELRKGLTVAQVYATAGIDFVPMPVLSLEHKEELIAKGNQIMQQMIDESGGES